MPDEEINLTGMELKLEHFHVKQYGDDTVYLKLKGENEQSMSILIPLGKAKMLNVELDETIKQFAS